MLVGVIIGRIGVPLTLEEEPQLGRRALYIGEELMYKGLENLITKLVFGLCKTHFQ